jgi:hypothetical protein
MQQAIPHHVRPDPWPIGAVLAPKGVHSGVRTGPCRRCGWKSTLTRVPTAWRSWGRRGGSHFRWICDDCHVEMASTAALHSGPTPNPSAAPTGGPLPARPSGWN